MVLVDFILATAVSFTVILKGSITTVLTRVVDVHEGLSDAGLPALGDGILSSILKKYITFKVLFELTY